MERHSRKTARSRKLTAHTYHPGMRRRRKAGLFDFFHRRSVERAYGKTTARGYTAAGSFLGRVAVVCACVLVMSVFVSIGINAYARSKQLTIRVDDGGKIKEMETQASTVRELVDSQAISLGPYDAISPAENTRLTQGILITIDRAMVVFVTVNNQMHQVYMTTGTVADALKKAGVDYSSNDIISPSLDTALLPGMRIRHTAVEYKIITELTRVPYEVITKNSASVEIGTQLLQSKGQEGVKTREIKVTVHNGVEVERVQLSEVMTKEPVDKIVLNGTKPKPVAAPAKSPANNNGNTTNNNNNTQNTENSGKYSHVTSADLKIPGVPGSFKDTLVMEVTAYTHTGNQVAIGGWPQYTRTREKPGTVAVDPDTIPYGTLVYITGYGYARAEDTGSFKGTRPLQIDVFMNTRSECIKWGRQRGVTVYIIEYNFSR